MVLDFLTTWHKNGELKLQQFSYKLVTLLMLVTEHRIQTLSILKIDNICIQNNDVVIKITDLIKISNPRRKQPLLVIPYYTKEEICVLLITWQRQKV